MNKTASEIADSVITKLAVNMPILAATLASGNIIPAIAAIHADRNQGNRAFIENSISGVPWGIGGMLPGVAAGAAFGHPGTGALLGYLSGNMFGQARHLAKNW
jgi:hypothetical protein